ncbi:hypothetical protein [Agrobacterium sp. SORGH_AS 787]|uniref:hypothetical protein n=1 Tax=Agrobacterium sp. SORGH_AS 787 TaxID=3041775 RepID=UPI00277E6083|nr:hypothetical protein [Rhizobium sp. SORGH_AS_0787]
MAPLQALGVNLDDLAVLTIAKRLDRRKAFGLLARNKRDPWWSSVINHHHQIRRSLLYHDWIAMGLLQVGMRFLLVNHPC